MPSRLTVVLVSLLLATAVLIFWFSLVIDPEVSYPEECFFIAEEEIICYGPSLTAVPLLPHTDLRILTLKHNNISSLDSDSFVSLTELEKLSVRYCGLRTIELGAFNGLTKLTELIITGNEISEIIPGTFKNMVSLVLVDLRYNRLEYLDGGVFSGSINLHFVYLQTNKLQYIHPDTYFGLPYLKHINLRFNPRLQIPTDRNFIKSHSLLHLDISHCNVSSVSVVTFANVSSLEWLDLSYNNLRTVDINILRALPKLSTLYLYGNRLQCDCQLQEVWQWCEDRNIETTDLVIEPKCVTTSEVLGMDWEVLETWECLQGNIEYYGDYNNTSYSYSNMDDMYTRTETDKYNDTETDTYNDTETDTYSGRETDTYSDRETDTYSDTETDTYNDTDTDTYDYNDTYSDTINSELITEYQVLLYAVPFVFGITSNVIILIIIICNKDMRTVPNMYIINLATSDIIYLTVLFSEVCVNRISYMWVRGGFMCTFLPFCRRLSVGLSAYSVAVLSLQRYKVTVNSLHVRVSSQPTWRATVGTNCGVWIVAALFAVPSARSKYLCRDFTFFVLTIYYRRVVIFELLVSCVLPLCVIAFSYIMTARHLLKTSHSLFEGTQNPQLKTRRNTAKILVGLTVVFLITYVPYHALWTYIICTVHDRLYETYIPDILDFSNFKLRYTHLISTCLPSINCCLNPVALFCTSSPFRQHLKRYLTCFCKTNFPSIDLELTRRN